MRNVNASLIQAGVKLLLLPMLSLLMAACDSPRAGPQAAPNATRSPTPAPGPTLTAFSKTTPATAEEYLERGRAYAKAGDYKQAIEDYNAALNLKPDYI